MTNRGKKRALSLALTLALLLGLFPTAALADEGLPACHPAHDTDCGYIETVEGAPCKHELGEHDAACGYAEGTPEIPCSLDCADTDGDGTIDHAEGCAYAPAAAGTPCGHVEHDADCGYIEAVEGAPCKHACNLCAPEDSAPEDSGGGESGPAPGAPEPEAARANGPEPREGGRTWEVPSEGALAAAIKGVRPGDTVRITFDSAEGGTYELPELDWSQVTVVLDRAHGNLSIRCEIGVLEVKNIGDWAFLRRSVGTLQMENGTVQLAADSGSPTVGTVTMTGGTFYAASNNLHTITGAFDFQGGDIDGTYLNLGPDGTFRNSSGGDVTVHINGTERTVVPGMTVGGDGNIRRSIGGLTVAGDPADYDYDGASHTLTVKDNADLTIANKDPGTATQDKIVVERGAKVQLTLAGVNIDVSSTSGACAFDMTGAEVELTLADGPVNVLKSGFNRAGLEAPATSTLTIGGSGKLEAMGGNSGAGIGGGIGGSGGDIRIYGSARVIATGGNGGTGIGGGIGGSGGDIRIYGSAQVIATGGGYGSAGIGGGRGNGGSGGDIRIYGSAQVIATGGNGGAGIGGGLHGDSSGGGSGGKIQIYGNATVTAVGSNSTGIGGGSGSNNSGGGSGGEIQIYENAAVTATGGNGAGIGGGNGGRGGAGGAITIEDNAVVFATGSRGADHIGGGYGTSSGGVGDSSGVKKTGGVIFEGTAGAVYGDVTLPGNLTIPDGSTLTIPDGKNLTNDHTLTNNGEVKGSGTLTGDGVFTGTGIYTLKVTRAIDTPARASVTKNSVTLHAVPTPKGGGTVQYGWYASDSAASVTNWQDGPTFTGLTKNTAYYFFARVTEGEIYREAVSDSLLVQTDRGSSSSGGGAPDYDRRTLTDKASGVKVEGRAIHESANLTVETERASQDRDAGCDLLGRPEAGHLLEPGTCPLPGLPGNIISHLPPVEDRNGDTLTVAPLADGKLTLSDVKASGVSPSEKRIVFPPLRCWTAPIRWPSWRLWPSPAGKTLRTWTKRTGL